MFVLFVFVLLLLKKAGLDLILKNYRPVSKLQYVLKPTERAVVNQLCVHSDCGFPLPPCQSACRTGHSTETALVNVQSDILLNMDQQKVTQLVLIDLSSALDTVDPDMLLNIMNCSFGVSGPALNWFSSYLQLKSQRIFINGTASERSTARLVSRYC